MQPEIKALIFDFGGVISKTLFETHASTEAALGLPNGSLTWHGPFDGGKDDLWEALQRREIRERDYWLTRAKEVGALIGQDWTSMKDFVQAARGQTPPTEWIRHEALDTIAKAKTAGLRLAILSNELDLFYGEDFSENLPLLNEFELLVDATYTEILKPDPQAFELVREGLSLPLSSCLLIDDQLENIEGAQALGLPFVHFDVTDPHRSYDHVCSTFV